MSKIKPNCYKCIHRRSLPGNEHSACAHPATEETMNNPFMGLISIMGGAPPIGADKLGVVGDPHGIRRGWFSWPANFDPTWLQACGGFAAKQE